jgi:hypothetical protein
MKTYLFRVGYYYLYLHFLTITIIDLKSAQDVKLLTKDGITHIINLISHKNNDY